MKKFKYIILAAAVLIIAGAGVSFHFYNLVFNPIIETEEFRLNLYGTEQPGQILESVRQQDSQADLRGLELLVRFKGLKTRSGSYVIKKGDSAKAIWSRLSSGSQTPVKVVINSCRDISHMAAQIGSQLMIDSAQIAQRLTDQAALDSLGYTIPTVFFMIVPNTYEFYWNVSLDAFMQRMVKEHDSFWNQERKDKAAGIGLTPLQVVTLASIVEEETAKTQEMPTVAGLYMNRYNRGMLLQADPTVIFALGGERPKRVLLKHLETDSPYNTYKYPGLPPAPIRFAGTASINAVLNYSRHNYLYMCAKEDFSGFHNFATTLSQHNANAKKYQQALSAAGIR